MALSTLSNGTEMRVFEIVAHGGIEVVDGERREKRESLGFVSATNAVRALDVLCEKVNADEPDESRHIRRVGKNHSVAVLGLGTIKAHEVVS